MPIFNGEVEKTYLGEIWVNRYYIQAADLATASAAMGTIANAERAITCSRVTFTKHTVRTPELLDYQFVTVPINLAGLTSNGTDELYALTVVVRVDFQATTGRPSRKYLRGVLTEAQTSGYTINSQLITKVQTSYANVLAEMDTYVDLQGTGLIAGSVHPKLGQRQLRRGSKKKPIQS